MNYKSKFGDGSSGIKKVQRVSDVRAMGYASTPQVPVYGQSAYPQENMYNPQQPQQIPSQQDFSTSYPNPNPNYYDPYGNTPPPTYDSGPPQTYGQSMYNPPAGPNVEPTGIGAPFTMLQQPMVQDMALQYGQKLADQGKQLVETQFEKYVPVTRLKYYFAVDNNYVVKKLILLLFPFTHKDWSLKYDHDNPVQPRYDINAPDLYIPTMAYITFVVLAGLVMGTQNQFTPEQLGIISSSALAYSIFELIIYSVTLYVSNISTSLKTLDLVAFSGYKFVAIDACILISIIFKRIGYYSMFLYTSITICFFLLRTLKSKILRDTSAATYDAYGNVQSNHDHYDQGIGRKRKLYFLFLISGLQPVLSFFLSYHLIPSKAIEAAVTGAL